jgi:hypothetical protein
METTTEKETLEEAILLRRPELRTWLTSYNDLWAGFSSMFALFLFVIWSVRLDLMLVSWVILVDLYAVGIFAALRKPSYRSQIQETNDNQYITFIKSGVTWKRITDSLIGLALISSIFVYLLSNALPNNPEFVSHIYTITLIIHSLIVPVIPALSKINLLPILKSKIKFEYDGNTVTEVSLELHPLDLAAPDEINCTK